MLLLRWLRMTSWKEGLLTSSRVHPTSFCSVTVIFNKLPSIAWGIIGLYPNFDWITLRRVRAGVNRIHQCTTRKVLLLGNCKIAHFRGTYCRDCFTMYSLYCNSNTISFFLYFYSWKRKCIKKSNTDILFLLQREEHSAQFQTLYYISRKNWVPRASSFVIISKSLQPALPEVM